MDRPTAVILVLLFATLFLVAVKISVDYPQGFGIYNGSTSATNPEGTIRFQVATQVQVTLISPPDGTTYISTGPIPVNLTCQANNLTGSVNITQIRLYTDITGVFTITNVTNVSGTPPYTVTFNLTGVPLGSYRWNCEAVSNVGNVFAPADWHFTIATTPPTPTPGGGGSSKRQPWTPPVVTEEPVIPPPPIIIEIPMPLPPKPNIINEFISRNIDLSQKQSLVNLMIQVPGKEDAKRLKVPASEESMIGIVSEAEPLPAYQNEWDLLSTVRMWKLELGQWQDFPLVAENKILNYRPVKAARLSTGNTVPVSITTIATGEISRKKLSTYTFSELPVTSPPYFVKFTDVVDGYVGVYFVLDGYNFRTIDNDFMIDFELSLNNELVLGDILSSAELMPGEYNIIYKRYKLPDLPEKGMYTLTSRVYEKGPILPKIVTKYSTEIDFRKETPTQMGKIMLS